MKIRKKINDDWSTPDYILDWVKKKYGSYFDPCPINPNFDGLNIKWRKVNFVNPPYTLKLKTAFVMKAIYEASQNKTCILLLPAATETRLFIELWNFSHEIIFVHKRIKFKGYNTKKEYVTDKTGQSGSLIAIMEGVRFFSDPKIRIKRFK